MEKTLFDQRTIADNIAGAVPMDNIAGTAGRPTTNGLVGFGESVCSMLNTSMIFRTCTV